VAPHWIPATGPVWVVLAGARAGPCSIGTPSNPSAAADPEDAVEELEDALDAVLDELLPHPASSSTLTKSGRIRTRVGIGS
jgi:hypothetical protein